MPTAPLFDDRDGFILLDGKITPWREAKIHVLTHALHYASCVFEGERAYGGKIFKSRDHSARLLKGAGTMGMAVPMDIDALEAAKTQVMEANGLTDCYVRAFVWRGSGEMGVSAQNAGIRTAIAAWPWGAYYSAAMRESGIKLCAAPWRRPAPDSAPVSVKAAGLYMICTLSKHAAEAQGCQDALMLDYRGYVAEATSANLFMVKDGRVVTPIADAFLDGITRRTVIALARDMGYEVAEARVLPGDLAKADEVFLTGSAAEVTAVGQIDDITYTVGPVTRAIRDAYADLVRSA
jgi:branched-chain amino acid aminotransferase